MFAHFNALERDRGVADGVHRSWRPYVVGATTHEESVMRSVIIGGGVAGCAVAAALRSTSHCRESVLIERRKPGASAGMGFILMPNGLRALDAIAPEFDWRAAGRIIEMVSLRNRNGEVLAEHSLEASVCISRERFLRMLRMAAAGTGMLEGWNLETLERNTDGSTNAIKVDDGTRIAGDIFFACDGARSRTRSLIFPEATLSDVAIHEIVSVAEAPELAETLGNGFQKFHDERGGLAVGMLAESATRVVWFVQFDAMRYGVDTARDTGRAATLAEKIELFVRHQLTNWAPEIAEAIDSTNFNHSHLWPTRDLPPLASLACGNLALVGDAAHACLPFTSQGANGALVDAAILGGLLADVGSREEAAAAFALYTLLRRPHHQKLFMDGRRLRAAFLAPFGARGPALPLVV